MKIVFRADSSLQIGTGHIMRCLTLAEEITQRGGECHFICRSHAGHINDFVRERGYHVHELLSAPQLPARPGRVDLAHAHWLGCSPELDASQSAGIVEQLQPDWVVVDHYALDERWERVLRGVGRKILVLDDLADRRHDCDLLLDQNLGRNADDYSGLLPQTCLKLIGPHYALLRPEFGRLRETSLKGREGPTRKRILITMGGVDHINATGEILLALKACSLGQDWAISVVMGAKAPWKDEVGMLAAQLPQSAEMLVNVNDMAARMADSDLVIGAAGGTAWERCCLGVPSLVVVLADNQWPGARALVKTGAAWLVGEIKDVGEMLNDQLEKLLRGTALSQMSACAAQVTDGLGVVRVVDRLQDAP